MSRARRTSTLALAALLVTLLALPASAAIKVYEEGAKRLEVGVGMQLQYRLFDPETGDETDQARLRRLRPDVRGTVTENWDGRLFFELGGASGENEVKVLDAWMRYKGDGYSVILGSRKPPFSREFLTAAWKQQLVERSFVGSTNYGTPDRSLGVRIDGASAGDRFAWATMFGSLSVDPHAGRLDFENPVNPESDFNEGWIAAGRLELQPLGATRYDQGDLERGPFRFSLALAGYSWSNDDDNNTYTGADGRSTSASKVDIDTATGAELAVGVRGGGLSFDAEYHLIDVDTVDPTFTGGLYENGSTEIETFAVEGGIMLLREHFEVVAGHQSLDSDHYRETWTRNSVGLNLFWNRHNAKLQLTYRMGESLNGVEGADADEAFLQLQFLF